MRWLKIVLAVKGVSMVGHAAQSFFAPTSCFLPSDAPNYALDVVPNVGSAILPSA